MSDFHEAVFEWPSPAKEVIVTGTFDQWGRTVHMDLVPSGFVATVPVHWGEKVLFKFFVDGVWMFISNLPTEEDQGGNINNVYHAPTKPKEIDTPLNEPNSVPVITPARAREQPGTLPEDVATPGNVPTILPTPPNLKSPLVIVPVNDSTTVDKPPVAAPNQPDAPSTHTILVNGPKEASPGTNDSSDTPAPEEGKGPELEVKKPNGTTDDSEPVDTPKDVATPGLEQPFAIVPVKDPHTVDPQTHAIEAPSQPDPLSTHALPVNNLRKTSSDTPPPKEEDGPKVNQPNGTTNGIVNVMPDNQPPAAPDATIPTAPITPQKSHPPGSKSHSPTTSESDTISKKKHGLFCRVKHLIRPGKEHHDTHHK